VNRKLIRTFATVAIGFLLACGSISAQPIWTDYYGGKTDMTLYNGVPAPIGSIVEILYEGESVGADTVIIGAGKYGLIGVIGTDDITTGEELTFLLNGRPATILGPEDATFGSMGDVKEVNLSAEGVVQADFDPATDQFGSPSATVPFVITVHNTGNGIDFYKITAVSSTHGWLFTYNEKFTYVHAGQTGHVTFSLIVPPSPSVAIEEIQYTVASMLDPTVNYSGTVIVDLAPTDADDETGDNLPGGFELFQNYPNPFNPSTTIAFELPKSSPVTVEVYNLLGELIERAELGRLSAGRHSYNFQAGNLASGIYLYRLKAGEYSAIKKMALLK